MTTDDFPLERYRPLLSLHLRQLQLGRLYQARFDSSDIVQESLLRAVKAFEQVRGQQEAERVRWLQAIVKNVLVDFVREHGAAKRDPRMEQTVCDAAGDWDTPLAAYLSASEPGPSTLMMRKEELLRLATAVDRLPEAERDAVIAHYILELPLCEVANRLERTEKGVAGLLYRGKRRLRELLAHAEGES
jgi:RNA polymerase sigma-70 factor, ECF subfamily